MTPLQYKTQYFNLGLLEVALLQTTLEQTCQGRLANIRVNSYRNANSSNQSESRVNLTEKNRLVNLMQQNGYNRSNRDSVARCFNGKGSVLDCRVALNAITELGITNDVQSYCDTNLGLDCSGFVNNYFNSVHNLPKKAIRFYYNSGRRNVRINFDDFRNRDVLIWCDSDGIMNSENGSSEHIAIIDRVREICSENMQATIVESCGGKGLVHSDYTFTKASTPSVFRVHRPLKTRNSYVKVVPVLLV
jgi:hypothetical protein